jgi:hypothetical protein
MSFFQGTLLVLALAMAFVADLTGNGIIAATGVGYTSSMQTEVSNMPFVQVGYFGNTNTTMFGANDQANYLFSSADYYLHIIEANDSIAFLPVQAGKSLPSAYAGNAYFGNMAADCKFSGLDGPIRLSMSDDGGFGMWGSLEIPFSDLASPQDVGLFITNTSFTRASTTDAGPYVGVFALPRANGSAADSPTNHFAVLHLDDIDETHTHASTNGSQSSGVLLINDGSSDRIGQPGGFFNISVCRLTLPISYGTITAPSIIPTPLPPLANCTLSTPLCPNISMYAAGPNYRTDAWPPSKLLAHLNATYTDSQTVQQALAPFPTGVMFCKDCSTTNVAARVLSTFVASAAGTAAFPAAFQTAILHALAAAYRNELPTLNGHGNATYRLLELATLIVNLAWLYVSVAYTFALITAAVSMRVYILLVLHV